MERPSLDSLVQRLVDDPHDSEALAHAHQVGESDPKGYAAFLERLGAATTDPAYASHWLAEAGQVWSTTLKDAHRAARVLMMAIDKDPTQAVAAERLAELYRAKGDAKALVALLDRRAKALTPLAERQPEIRGELAGIYEELGRVWAEAPLSQTKKAIDAFKKAIEFDPKSAYAIFSLREVLKAAGQYADAIPLYAAELSIEQDPARRVGLLRDEAATRKSAGDLEGATRALAQAREIDPDEPSLQQEFAASVLDRLQANDVVAPEEKELATALLIALAETYEGEHGLAYATATLDIDPGHDRGIQLCAFYAHSLAQEADLATRYTAYLASNPDGAMAGEVRHALASIHESAGQFREAIAVLTPLKNAGDDAAAAKMMELAPLAGSVAASPPASPARPAPSSRDVSKAKAPPSSKRLSEKELPEGPSSLGELDQVLSTGKKSAAPPAGSVPPPPGKIGAPPAPESEPLTGARTAEAPQAIGTAPLLPHLRGARSAAKESSPRPLESAPQASEPSPPSSDEVGGFENLRKAGPETMQDLLDAAQILAGKGKKVEAQAKFKAVLASDPAQPDALAWMEDYLRLKREYVELREVLFAAVRATSSAPETLESRKERLREIAGLCEGNLRDIDGAVNAWKQLLSLDRRDDTARQSLTRLLEKAQRWDDLVSLLAQEATVEQDLETKISLERKLAKLQEDKRHDLVAAGEAWTRISRLTPDDEFAVQTAAKLFERAERPDLAVQVIADSTPHIEDPMARGALLQRLAELREALGDIEGAGDSFSDAADAQKSPKLWEEAERVFVAAEKWDKAAHAATQRSLFTSDTKQQASNLARASDYLNRAGDDNAALASLEEATDLDPINDDYAALLGRRYTSTDQVDKLVAFLTRRGDRLSDRVKRVNVRREAAVLASKRLADKELARELWLKILEDGDDREALENLIDDAINGGDFTEATTLLRRLGTNTTDRAEKTRITLREAELLAEGVGDIETAVIRYEYILAELDSTCRPALQAIADLEEKRERRPQAADALERELKLVADVNERGQIGRRLARLYETLEDPKSAIRALDIVRKADPEDFDALTQLSDLCELSEQWDRVAELLVERIEAETDQHEISFLTKKLAQILADKLNRGDEALGTLTDLADQGDAAVREAYIELGDKLGWQGIVATKMRDWWFDAKHGPERTQALRGAFDRFAAIGRDQDAVQVALEIVRAKGAGHEIAGKLEEMAVKAGDHDAIETAHTLLAKETTGAARAEELVRQAEVRAKAGMSREEALQHGESGISSTTPSEAEPLLERLAQLAAKPADVIDLYERQVSRSKAPQDRIRALARAAQVASQKGQADRSRGFFELALSGAPATETLELLETTAKDGDKSTGGDRLRRALMQAMATGGHGARDGGRTRSALLRRSAELAHQELKDTAQAFAWLAEALVAHVDPEALDALEALANDVGDPRKCDDAIGHALSEVFDGPLVRQLLSRRAKLRRETLKDLAGAAADLKKLHDLSPTDQAVLDDLAGLLTDLGDFRGLVQLYEDQILRGRDVTARSELARKVARIWEEQLLDARETADAWRRVLRLKAGDEEATAGLERAKANMLKKADPDSIRESYAPPRIPHDKPRPSIAPPPERPKSTPPIIPIAPTPPKVPTVPPPAPEAKEEAEEPSSDLAAKAAPEVSGAPAETPPAVPEVESQGVTDGEEKDPFPSTPPAASADAVAPPMRARVSSTPPPLPASALSDLDSLISPSNADEPSSGTMDISVSDLNDSGSVDSLELSASDLMEADSSSNLDVLDAADADIVIADDDEALVVAADDDVEEVDDNPTKQ